MKNTDVFKRLLGYLKAHWFHLLFVLISAVISTAFMVLAPFLVGKVTSKVMQTLRQKIDEKMHRLKLNYYDTHTHGDILSIITNDVDTINNTISQNLTSVVTQITTAVGVLLMMLAISPALSLIPIVMVPLSLFSAAGVMKASEKYYRSHRRSYRSRKNNADQSFDAVLRTKRRGDSGRRSQDYRHVKGRAEGSLWNGSSGHMAF